MPDVLLVTCAAHPEGEPGAEPGGGLVAALESRGLSAAWAVWDDAAVDWAGARLVAARSTWDYQQRAEEFLAWAREVGAVTTLLNGADVFAWNLDKSYLVPLADDVPVVPTRLLGSSVAGASADVAAALADWGTVVVKPRTGAGGVGVLVVSEPDDERLAGLDAPALAQPLVTSIATEGETSVFVLGGRAVSQAEKRPVAGEIRVHEAYGGHTRPVPLDDDVAALAERAVAAAEQRWQADLAYARVDLLRDPGRPDGWWVSELELIEPGLYLEEMPGNADLLADLVAARLPRG